MRHELALSASSVTLRLRVTADAEGIPCPSRALWPPAVCSTEATRCVLGPSSQGSCNHCTERRPGGRPRWRLGPPVW
jgi:hypothetical protein